MVPGVTKALIRGWVYRSRVQLNPDSGPRRNCHHPGTIAFNFAEHRRSRLQRRQGDDAVRQRGASPSPRRHLSGHDRLDECDRGDEGGVCSGELARLPWQTGWLP
jgi:hypothetical protein